MSNNAQIDNLRVQSLSVVEITSTLQRSWLAQDSLAEYVIPYEAWYIWDSGARLPNTSSSDDLGFYPGTFASASPLIRTYDVKTLTTTLYARCKVTLPPEYVTGETVTLRFHAGMVTTVAGTSATIDVQAYKMNEEGGIGSDICATAAQSINSLTYADKDFEITPSTLAAGDELDVRVAIAVTDAATGTAVIGSIGKASLLCDIKG